MSALAARITHTPRPRAFTDGGVLVVLAVLAGISARFASDDVGFGVGLAVGVAPLLVLFWRRDAPVLVFVLAQLLAVPSRLLVGANGPAEMALLVVIYTVASRRSAWWAGAVVVIDAAVLAVVLLAGTPTAPVGIELIGQLAAGVVAALLGMYVQSRRTVEQALRERAERLDRERELNARAAVEEERRHIARELHDVVAHHVSVMTLQAGALEKRLRQAETDADLDETAAGIRRTGQQAMTELRRLLGLLHSDDDGGRSPQPDLGALDLLAARMRDSGMPLELHVTGPTQEVSAGMALAVYRIVQEALTNTLRHAGPVPTTVEVTVGAAEVQLTVRDAGTAPDAPPTYPSEGTGRGHGLVGMRERASLFSGTVTAGPHPDGGFEVSARLPRDASHGGGASAEVDPSSSLG